MGKGTFGLYAFNRGIVSPQALARIDLERMRLSSEQQNNWFPRTLGCMSLRPGTEYLLSTKDDAVARPIPFFFSTTQKAILECTPDFLRPLVDDDVITRASVATAVTNGDFSSGTGWTINSTGGASATISGGKLTFACVPIDSYATVIRSITIASGDQNVEHAFRIIVDRGPVVFYLGSSSGGAEYISKTTLGTGEHSLAFTPTGSTAFISFESSLAREVIVDSIQIEAAGTLTLPTPWGADELPDLRWSQSGDVVFVNCYGLQERRIERRAIRSWSVVLSEPTDGPFAAIPSDPNVKLSINKAIGNATLTASRPFFVADHVGALFRMFTPGYNFSFDLAQADAYSPPVRVNGVGGSRTISVVTTGTWSGTLTVQKSYTGEDAGFTDSSTITTNTTTNVSDTADNVAVWIRVGFKSGNYTSGTATAKLTFGAGGNASTSNATSSTTSVGGRTGVCRVLSVTNDTMAEVDIFSLFSSSLTTQNWSESEWSERQGWPSANAFHEGRLFRAGRDKIWGSISDAYSSFDPDQVGDSGPIQRSIGYGPVQVINWLLPLARLMVGSESAEIAVRSSSFDEPLTPTNFALKDVSTNGSARLPAVKVDKSGVFVERSGCRVKQMAYSIEANDFTTSDLTQLVPDLNLNNPVIDVVIQRQPDTRIHCIRADGTVAILVFEPDEEVRCWVTFETDGVVENGVVLPGTTEDQVYYVIKRTINGVDKRYIERFALENECVGETLNKQADCFLTYTGSSTATITGLDHLEGESVIVWADGKDFSPDDGTEDRTQTTFTVSGGSITLPSAVTNAVVGLPYEARFKGTKLAYAAQRGTALNQKKMLSQLGLVLHKTHYQGLYHGNSFDIMDCLPLVEQEAEVAADTIYEHYDENMMEHASEWSTDDRLCLLAKAPRPCTILAAVMEIETHG